MRLIAVTDIHGDHRKSRKLAEVLREEEFDALLVAGDLTHFSGSGEARKVLKPLLELGKPLFAVHGNCDGRDVPELLSELGVNVHDNRVELGGELESSESEARTLRRSIPSGSSPRTRFRGYSNGTTAEGTSSSPTSLPPTEPWPIGFTPAITSVAGR